MSDRIIFAVIARVAVKDRGQPRPPTLAVVVFAVNEGMLTCTLQKPGTLSRNKCWLGIVIDIFVSLQASDERAVSNRTGGQAELDGDGIMSCND